MTEDKGKWRSRSFSVHSKKDKDLIAFLNIYAAKKQQSDVVRRALRFFIKYQNQTQRLSLGPVLERLDRIERKLDQGAIVAPDSLVEDRSLANDLDGLIGLE